MKRARIEWCTAAVAVACNGSVEVGQPGDATVADATWVDTTSHDGAADATGPCIGESCTPFDRDGAATCPCEAGSVCVREIRGALGFQGCVPLPVGCCGIPSCECMGRCACEGGCFGPTDALPGGFGLECVARYSRRATKREIKYVDDAERTALADRALATRLATYVYNTDARDARRRLGFIIDDQPVDSFAVETDGAHVDLYGYSSLLLAALQAQQREIEDLKRRLERLERS